MQVFFVYAFSVQRNRQDASRASLPCSDSPCHMTLSGGFFHRAPSLCCVTLPDLPSSQSVHTWKHRRHTTNTPRFHFFTTKDILSGGLNFHCWSIFQFPRLLISSFTLMAKGDICIVSTLSSVLHLILWACLKSKVGFVPHAEVCSGQGQFGCVCS